MARGLVSVWLRSLGLNDATVASFKKAGIDTPDALAGLSLSDYDSLGVDDEESRAKLFILVQRIRLAVRGDDSSDSSDPVEQSPGEEDEYSVDLDHIATEDNASAGVISDLSQTIQKKPLQPSKAEPTKKIETSTASGIENNKNYDYSSDDLDPAKSKLMPPSPSKPKILSPSKLKFPSPSKLKLPSTSKLTKLMKLPSPSKLTELMSDTENSPKTVSTAKTMLFHMRKTRSRLSLAGRKKTSESSASLKIKSNSTENVKAADEKLLQNSTQPTSDRLTRNLAGENLLDEGYRPETGSDSQDSNIPNGKTRHIERVVSTRASTTATHAYSAPPRNFEKTENLSSDLRDKNIGTSRSKSNEGRRKKEYLNAHQMAGVTECKNIVNDTPHRPNTRLSLRIYKESLVESHENDSNGRTKPSHNGNKKNMPSTDCIETNKTHDSYHRNTRLGPRVEVKSSLQRISERSERRSIPKFGVNASCLHSSADSESSIGSGSYKRKSAIHANNARISREKLIRNRRKTMANPNYSENKGLIRRFSNIAGNTENNFNGNKFKPEIHSQTSSKKAHNTINVVPEKDVNPSRRVLRSSSLDLRPKSETIKKDTTSSRRSSSVRRQKKSVNSGINTNASVFVHGRPEDKSWGALINRQRKLTAGISSDECFASPKNSNNLYEDDDDSDRSVDEDMQIRVTVRKRPMSSSEKARDEVDVIQPLGGRGKLSVHQARTRVDLSKEVETATFAFDNVFTETANNYKIYNKAVKNLIPTAFIGGRASVFAYGQTGSGKTFTMMGSALTGLNAAQMNETMHFEDKANLGLYYLAALDVFKLVERNEFSHLIVGVSLFEIYGAGGKLFDLLNKRKAVKCLEDSKGKVCFPGLSEQIIDSAENLMEIINAGAENRSTGTTSANADSSRSHAVLQLTLRNKRSRNNAEHGRLTFIDLAGSERGADTDRACKTTRTEGQEINRSLLALKEVIRALATGKSAQHIPFRGSKLTQVLKDSFVGPNTRTVVVACIAPNLSNCETTLNTIRYVDRIKQKDPRSIDLNKVVKPKIKTPSCSDYLQFALKSDIKPNQEPKTSAELEDIFDESWVSSSVGHESYSLDDFNAKNDPGTKKESCYIDVKGELGNSESTPLSVDSLLSSYSDSNRIKGRVKEAAENLMSSHRSTMTKMMVMVKQEMALVNETDSGHDSMERYVRKLQIIQESKLEMVKSLRELLSHYATARENVLDKNEDKLHVESYLSDMDSIEDLRA
eukprot:CAMPEP_0194270156 /NCGR_PEP_ID=MMETSP0169-20130528/4198_1 /TAXON_ID=218684 /ORGANISM="Corethron pennatum, Strain L29A3" /LENGTH=1245 /DNA_ID=CAMNT_0039012093 /DNA_START=37 /DNA_END=3774 /DNA_ORIENTATION=+